jgi:hypothetical protein
MDEEFDVSDAEMMEEMNAAFNFEVESLVVDIDREAQIAGIVLTDSAVRSVLIKVISTCNGKPPKAKSAKAGTKDAWILDLYIRIMHRVGTVAELLKLPGVDTRETFLIIGACLNNAKLSLESVSDHAAGTRAYLDDLSEFVDSARRDGTPLLSDVLKMTEDEIKEVRGEA